jgi:predicted small lipoprotein YifL
MKLARLFLAVLAVGTLAACGETVTGPQAAPPATPSQDVTCTLEDGTSVCRTGQSGSGG